MLDLTPGALSSLLAVSTITLLSACSESGGINSLQGEATLTPEIVSFGDVDLGARATREITLKNTGAIRVTVGAYDTDAPFAVISGPDEGTVLTPGEEATIGLAFEPTTPGTATGSFTIAGLDLSSRLIGNGIVATAPRLETTASLNFGTVEVGEVATAFVIVTNRGDGPAQITDAAFRNGNAQQAFTLGETPPFDIAPNQTIRIPVNFAPATADLSIGWIDFKVDVESENFEVTLSGQGSFDPQMPTPGTLSCTPGRLDFGSHQRGEVLSQAVECAAVGGDIEFGFLWLWGAFDVPDWDAGFILVDGQSITIDVEFDTNNRADTYNDEIELDYTSLGFDRTTIINVSGTIELPTPEDTAITLVLDWNAASDLDLHLVRPEGEAFNDISDCYFGNRTPDWGRLDDASDDPYLDTDVLNGSDEFGTAPNPETINLADVSVDGEYGVFIHHYSSSAPAGGPEDAPADPVTATIEVHVGGRLVATHTQDLTCKALWEVGTIHWAGSSSTFEFKDLFTHTGTTGGCPDDPRPAGGFGF